MGKLDGWMDLCISTYIYTQSKIKRKQKGDKNK